MNAAVTEPDSPGAHGECAPEDLWRAGTFRILATLLARPPTQSVLDRLAVDIDGGSADGEDPIARAWAALATAARRALPERIAEEYQQLFIGMGRGELVPYGSWYLTGFLMERPLGDLRRQLSALGLERSREVKEPEDHIAALFEVMALLITDREYGIETERRFFGEHVAPWAARFFEDLENASSAGFYRSVGRLGSEFTMLEKRCQSMPV